MTELIWPKFFEHDQLFYYEKPYLLLTYSHNFSHGLETLLWIKPDSNKLKNKRFSHLGNLELIKTNGQLRI